MAGVTNTTDLAWAETLYLENQFKQNIESLQNLLGISRLTRMDSGSLIKTYEADGTLEGGTVNEGETIPLSEMKVKESGSYELEWKKYRKSVSAEAIQKSGRQVAITDTDTKLIRMIQSEVRNDLVEVLGTGTAEASGDNLQASVMDAWGKLQVLFEDNSAGSVVVIANPMDVADYLGSSNISVQDTFGMTYFEAFTGVKFLVTAAVPQGTFYATVADNLNICYANVSGGDIGSTFSMTTEESGLLGIAHTPNPTNATYETLVITGLAIFPERIDGIVVGTIGA